MHFHCHVFQVVWLVRHTTSSLSHYHICRTLPASKMRLCGEAFLFFIFHVLALVICFGAGDGSLMYFSDIPSFFGSDHGKLSSYLPLFWFWSWQSTGPWSFSHFRWLPFFQLSFSPCLVFQTQTRRPWFTWRKVHSRPIFCCHWPWSSFRVCRWCTLGAWWWPSPWRKAGSTEESPSKRSALR